MEQRVRERAEGGEKSNVEIVKLDNFSVPVALLNFTLLPVFSLLFIIIQVNICLLVCFSVYVCMAAFSLSYSKHVTNFITRLNTLNTSQITRLHC